MTNKIRIVFFSSSDFCIPILDHIITNPLYELTGVVTQPDWENRGIIYKNPVSKYIENKNIKIFQPFKLNKSYDDFIKIFPEFDLGIVASYGQIINNQILNHPKLGMINWHPSLLPKYRGPTPLQSSILNNDQNGGLTWIKMSSGMDSGPIIKQYPIEYENHTFTILINIIGKKGAETLDEIINLYLSNRTYDQEDSSATYTKMLNKEMSYLNDHHQLTSEAIFTHFKAFSQFPKTIINTKRFGMVKLLDLELFNLLTIKIDEEDEDFFYSTGKILLKTKNGALKVNELQLPTGRKIKSSQ
jgi:methionyl-tRNA formyltransferase